MTNQTPALPYDRESRESIKAYEDANQRLGQEGLYTLRISTSRYHIDHVKRFENPKYTVNRQPLNPRTGKPWQASREILETEDLNEALALIASASRTQPVAPAPTPAPEPAPVTTGTRRPATQRTAEKGVTTIATKERTVTFEIKTTDNHSASLHFRFIRDGQTTDWQPWQRGAANPFSSRDERLRQAGRLIEELERRHEGVIFSNTQRKQIIAAFKSQIEPESTA